MPRFVLEIGTEELPPRFFPPALAQLREEGASLFERARLSCADIKVYGTPRRLVLIAEDLSAEQASATREERGPAARVAYDGDGNPTKAAEGFARRHGITPQGLEVRTTDQGDYVFAVIREPELPAKEALAPLLSDLITSLSFPKSMRWGEGKLRFGRPIRWLLALLDEGVVEFELEGLRSGRETRGHPVLADGMFPVARAADYERTLESLSVIVSQDERRARVEQEVQAKTDGADLVDGGLLEDTTFLVEWPTTACGSFDPSFLRLPEAVLIEEMQHVQSYFPLRDRDGKLLPRFIAVRDGGEDHLDTVLVGWENVLRAKLIDADFFYEQDRKLKLADRVEALRGVVFQEKLGSVYEKMERVRAVAADAASQLSLSSDDTNALARAALLCKADLTTQVVADLPNLQGVMGREYARLDGEPPEVAAAIGEHYRPRSADDPIPESKLGRILSVADKLDTLAALFAMGLIPSGSADPYGLRREAYGIINTLVTSGEAAERGTPLTLSVSRLVSTALGALDVQTALDQPREETIARLTEFLRDRMDVYLRDRGVRYDLVDAALAVGIDDISQAEKRAQALHMLQAREEFLPTVIACTRPINIAKDFEGADVAPDLFREDAERELWSAYQDVLAEADRVSLIELFALISERLRAPIDRYFDDVLVMDEDETLRRNRLAMCWNLAQLFRRIADFSLVVQA
jgi:glycyl-tRNA synthetase beta chain